jgi:hypothetical protein
MKIIEKKSIHWLIDLLGLSQPTVNLKTQRISEDRVAMHDLFRRACGGETEALIEWLTATRNDPEFLPAKPSLAAQIEQLEDRVSRLESEVSVRTARSSSPTSPANAPAAGEFERQQRLRRAIDGLISFRS